ncbi:YbhB/YbcL family Raf kinase inhibitor-like protein [Aggregicoccus sp. 17bor-14]|uniref:YbhB/YbcL family Raf kinase inhibitor-like protein n=1 Tax=Myxococcaceae TaxID=31 RepID=UPI00129C6D59|nr:MULTISPECIES: YbhB/YbcL family Raf kinase inhibitor-like protein [Myxococcaceae]MBF5043070.1 YbhB/YbcL family Raf kinase inhibitor-like protein [Simulacricoccus sp. 17bor-14]MRI88833.1 YbhB/YbcL family Raf kinase inhibitor-like protein [Aggregicoccus sp. 17bor-14]
MSLQLHSEDFEEGAPLPRRLTCEGEDRSPALAWEGAPPGTGAYALVVDDPDAPDPAHPRTRWVHWVLYNLPKEARGLPAGASGASLPPGAREGLNDWQRAGYGGPCPPVGRHRYVHTLYALDGPLPDLGRPPTRAELEAAMGGHVLARTQLIGTYQKGQPG